MPRPDRYSRRRGPKRLVMAQSLFSRERRGFVQGIALSFGDCMRAGVPRRNGSPEPYVPWPSGRLAEKRHSVSLSRRRGQSSSVDIASVWVWKAQRSTEREASKPEKFRPLARPVQVQRQAVPGNGNHWSATEFASHTHHSKGGLEMGRGILLWLLGIPLPIIILLLIFAR